MCVCVCVHARSADTEDVCIVERLFSSSLVAIVSLKAPRKLKVCHFKKGTEICNYSYSNTILAVKLNRQVGTHTPHTHTHTVICDDEQECVFQRLIVCLDRCVKLLATTLQHWRLLCVFQRLIVCLEESLYIHNIRDMKVLHTIRETPPNPSGKTLNLGLNPNPYIY